MIQIPLNKIGDVINFVIPITSETHITGVLEPWEIVTGETDNAILFADEFITGMTSSKLSFIEQSFPGNAVYVATDVIILGTDIKANITSIHDTDIGVVAEYTMYLETDFPIYYTDSGDTTTFKFKPFKNNINREALAYRMAYLGIIDEPKLDGNVFISRGVNNIFESFKRLRTVANQQELKKTGFGFFKQYDSGIL